MTDRELMVMVKALPEESAFRRAASGDPWTTTMHLLANLQDIATFSRADYSHAHGGDMKAEPIRRPGAVAAQENKLATARAMHDQMMAAMRGDN
jgi:hypothetical protein